MPPREVDVAPLLRSSGGRLFLHSMPGRSETVAQTLAAMLARGITRVVRLTSDEETVSKSREYFWASTDAKVWPFATDVVPVADFGTPADRAAHDALARDVAARLRAGESVLVHCGAGIGRSGTFACCVLVALGATPAEALRTVLAAGSGPETEAQMELVCSFG